MTNISKEAVERHISEDLLGIAFSAGLKITDIDVENIRKIATILRALQDCVEEVERDDRVSEWVAQKREKAAKRNGRLQGLDDAAKACRENAMVVNMRGKNQQYDIYSAQPANNTEGMSHEGLGYAALIEALKEQSQ